MVDESGEHLCPKRSHRNSKMKLVSHFYIEASEHFSGGLIAHVVRSVKPVRAIDIQLVKRVFNALNHSITPASPVLIS